MKLGNDLILPDDIKRTILWYFENYWGVINTIAQERNEVLFGGVLKELDAPIKNNQVSDSTSKKAILLTKLDLDEMIAWIRVVNDTYKYFLGKDKIKADLILLTFIQIHPARKSKTEIIKELHVSRDRYYFWLNEIYGIAGLIAASKRLIELEVS